MLFSDENHFTVKYLIFILFFIKIFQLLVDWYNKHSVRSGVMEF